MKTTSVLILTAILSLTFSGSEVCGQTVAIGHVTAEVIESISATSNATTSFELAMIDEGGTQALKEAYLNSEKIDMGRITLHSANGITCNVVMKSAALSDSEGNGFTLDPSVSNNSYASAAKPNGSQTFQLNGRTNRTSTQSSGNYQGSYTVVFAYN